MAGFNDFSTTPLNNSSIGSINFAENQLPSTLNNSARQLMADLRYELGTISSDVTAGATTDLGAVQAGSIVVVGNSTIGSFGTTGTAGLRKRIKVTGTPTLSVSTAGAIRGPTNAAIVCQANDVFDVLCEASDVWRITGYLRADGTPVTNSMMPIQQVSTETGAVATGSTQIPGDDTIPQNTEGDQYMTLAITPKSATSTLVIEVVANVALSTPGVEIAALFQDTTANALAAAWSRVDTTDQPVCISFAHKMTSGTTSATTFNVRIGANTTGTTTFNGSGGARFLGGVMASSMRITEVLA